MQPADLNVIKEIPGYKVILKTVLKTQIQQLVEQLADHTGEESVILTASVSDGTLSHLGSDSGKVFLEDHDDIKTQFLGFCLKRHHKQKQLEKEKQQQQESLMESANRLLSMPTTPTRFGTGMRPRFTPTRVPPSPRQQFSPRFQTSPRQSFSSPNQGRIQSSPRLQPVPLTGISPQGAQRVGQGNVRHEPYPAARPRRPALNFNQQGRSPNINQKKSTSTMKLPTEPQNVKKINIDPNEVIKIEAADEDEEVQIKTKPPERQLSCETGIKIASVSGATEISTAATAGSAVTTDTNKSSISQAPVVEPSISRAPSISSAPSPSRSSQPVSPTTMPVLSPIPKEENSNSSASTIVNESSDTKISDIAPPEGLSLGSDLSKLTGIPTKTTKTEGLEPSSAASTSTVSQDSSSGDGQSVKVKVEATSESEMELQITGMEPGQMAHGQNNQVPDLQNRMDFGPSTSGMSNVGDVMGTQMNQEYSVPLRTVGHESQFGDVSAAGESVIPEDLSLAMHYASILPDMQAQMQTQLLPLMTYGDSRWQCGDCGKGCQTKFALDMHLRTHTGEKPYACDVCEMRFNVKGNMKRHRLTHLSDEELKPPDQGAPNESNQN